jgi:hypothetical protein
LFVLGHVGIGTRMLGPLRRRLPVWPLVLGCLLPDLIDKPLYYLLPRSDLISGTRTFGHTLLFCGALIAAAAISRSRALWAVAAGVATHLALDSLGELFRDPSSEARIWSAIVWPALDGRFPEARFRSLLEHLRISARSLYLIGGELVGAAILLHAAWKRRQSS